MTSGALGGMHDEDDLYAGAAGVGRYMLDDTAFPMAQQGASGVGEYIQVPPQMDGLSGAGHDDSEYDELMDELGAVPALTPDEEQAENILIPQLAYEAMQGGMGQVSPAATIKARQPNASIIRTTPGMAAKVEAYNIGGSHWPKQAGSRHRFGCLVCSRSRYFPGCRPIRANSVYGVQESAD